MFNNLPPGLLWLRIKIVRFAAGICFVSNRAARLGFSRDDRQEKEMKMPSERQNVRSDGILSGTRHRANAFKHSLTNAGPLYINPLYTWTAVAPKRIFSAASLPSIMPPTPIIGSLPSMWSANSFNTRLLFS